VRHGRGLARAFPNRKAGLKVTPANLMQDRQIAAKAPEGADFPLFSERCKSKQFVTYIKDCGADLGKYGDNNLRPGV